MKKTPLRYWISIYAILIALIAGSCERDIAQVSEYNIIPEPAYMVQKARSFTISSHTKLYFENLPQNSPTSKFITNTLRQMHIRPAFAGRPNRGSITITLNDTINPALGEEGYLLQVTPKGIFMSANTEAGLIYAFGTFVQMLPEEIHQHAYRQITLPECTILDYPRFPWRGSHLDVCRHFIPVKQIKRHIDLMSAHKLNKFHWHLSDDQGWRIESEKHPELNDIGSWRTDRSHASCGDAATSRSGEVSTYGGYYTQAEIADIVQYAKTRNVEVIPAIELPNHASAILATYPQLSCHPKEHAVAPPAGWPTQATLCVGNEKTVQFIDDILDEIAEIFPSEFIHIGFDNIDTYSWERCPLCQRRIRQEQLGNEDGLTDWLVAHIEAHLSRKGKRIIGWNGMLNCNSLSADAVIMSSQGDSDVCRSAVRGNGVINTNANYCDLDTYQADSTYHPAAFPQYIPLSKTYQFDPMPQRLTSDVQQYCWGGEAILWTNYIQNYEQAEHFLLPRLCALAECFWSQSEKKDWNNFRKKIEKQKMRLAYWGYRPCRGSFKPTLTKTAAGDSILITLTAEVENTYIYYTTDGSSPTPESSIYTTPIPLPKGTLLRTLSLYNGAAQEGVYDFVI